jgi:hypothetical protein
VRYMDLHLPDRNGSVKCVHCYVSLHENMTLLSTLNVSLSPCAASPTHRYNRVLLTLTVSCALVTAVPSRAVTSSMTSVLSLLENKKPSNPLTCVSTHFIKMLAH